MARPQLQDGRLSGCLGVSNRPTRGTVFNAKKAALDQQACSSHYSDSTVESCPEFLLLPERSKFLLDKIGALHLYNPPSLLNLVRMRLCCPDLREVD